MKIIGPVIILLLCTMVFTACNSAKSNEDGTTSISDQSGDDSESDTSAKVDEDLDGDEFSVNAGDCNDEDPDINPDAEELCGDGIDNNCDGLLDEGCDCNSSDTQACGSDVGECVSGTQLCDGGLWSDQCDGETYAVAEICNDGLDNDCDEATDCEDADCAGASNCDGDGDGISVDDGDCNDNDDQIFPDALDTPDTSYIDSNCDGVDGDRDMIWVDIDNVCSDSTCDGTIEDPLNSINDAIEMATDTGKDIYVIKGSYPYPVTMEHGINIFGGYGELDLSGNRARAINDNRVFFNEKFSVQEMPTNGDSMHIGGIVFKNGIVLHNTSINIEDCHIFNGTVEAGDNATLYLNLTEGTSTSHIKNNSIVGTMCDGQEQSTIAVLIETAGTAVATVDISDNGIAGEKCINNSTTALMVHASGQSNLEIDVIDNNIVTHEAADFSAGIIAYASDNSLQNVALNVSGNTISSADASESVAISIGRIPSEIIDEFGWGDLLLDGNTLLFNGDGIDVDISTGVDIHNLNGIGTISNNWILSDSATYNTGVRTTKMSNMNDNLNIVNNTFVMGKYSTDDGNSLGILMNDSAEFTMIENNIFLFDGGSDNNTAISNVNFNSPESLPTIVSNLFDSSIFTLYNDISYSILGISSLTDLNDSSESFHDNITGDAALENVSAKDFHLTSSSAAIDAGLSVNELVPDIDIDGDSRKDGAIDIGADEYIVSE